jgi:predicted amidophosphoribosyltransferase
MDDMGHATLPSGEWAAALARVRTAALDAAAVLAPTDCSGCGATDRALCSSCVAALRPDVALVDAGAPGSTDGPFAVFCALRYSGVARHVLLAVKETGRTDAAATLARALSQALGAALATVRDHGELADEIRSSRGGVEIATIPSTRSAYRMRGYHPTALILAHAGVRACGVLRAARQTADQAGLSSAERAANRRGSLTAVRRLDGRCFVLVDDIVTTGATLREARRAVTEAGGRVFCAVALANTALLRAGR